MKATGWFLTAVLAGTLCAVASQAQANCTGGSSTCAGPPPTVHNKPLQPYVTPAGGANSIGGLPSGVTQPSSIPPGDAKILNSQSTCYALGQNSGDYVASGGTDYVAVCKAGYTMTGDMAPVTTHTCGSGTYSLAGLTCQVYPDPTVTTCAGGTEPEYIYGSREDSGVCPTSGTNTSGWNYVTQQANMSTVTSPDLSKAAPMCCPVVNGTKAPG